MHVGLKTRRRSRGRCDLSGALALGTRMLVRVRRVERGVTWADRVGSLSLGLEDVQALRRAA